jgi:hypothetical protein
MKYPINRSAQYVERNWVRSYRLGLRPTAARPPCMLSVSDHSDTGSRFLDWCRSRRSKILYTFVDGVVLMNPCKSPNSEIPPGYWSNSYHGVVLCAFANLRKATMSFVLSVGLTVRPPARTGQNGCHWTDFHEIWYSNIFRKSVEKIKVSLKFDNNTIMTDTLREEQCTFMIISPYNGKCFRRNAVEKITTQSCFGNFFWKSCLLLDNVEKCSRARDVTDDNTIRQICLACWITNATDPHLDYAMMQCVHCLSFEKCLSITSTVGSLPLICVY